MPFLLYQILTELTPFPDRFSILDEYEGTDRHDYAQKANQARSPAYS